jgi:hypothetical protein
MYPYPQASGLVSHRIRSRHARRFPDRRGHGELRPTAYRARTPDAAYGKQHDWAGHRYHLRGKGLPPDVAGQAIQQRLYTGATPALSFSSPIAARRDGATRGDTLSEDAHMTFDYHYPPIATFSGWYCGKCNTWVPNGVTHGCSSLRPAILALPLGWVCPQCRRGVAPDVKQCPCQEHKE